MKKKIAFASRHAVLYCAENEPGAAPENPRMKYLRNTSCSLNLSRDSFVSNELRQDRQISDVRTGTNQVGGDIGIELSYGNFDDFIEAALCGTWKDNEVTAGIEERSFTIERAFNDIKKYTAYKGCFVNTFSLSIQPNAMATGTFGIIGMDAETRDVPLCENPTPAETEKPYDTYTGELKEGERLIAVVTGIEMNLDNGIEPQFVLFRRDAPFVSYGKSNITGTLTAFFENQDLIQKFLDETPTSLEFTLGGPEGSYTFILPNIRYTGADDPVDGDGPISISMPFQAVLDECTGTNIIVRRNPPANEGPQTCQLEYSADALAESEGNPGTIEETITATLSGGRGKVFSGADNEILPGVTFTGVPDGMAAEVIRKSPTTAEISLKGKAASHDAASSTQMTVSFAASAFSRGYCHCEGGVVEGSEKTITLTLSGTPSLGEAEVNPGEGDW